jgi:F-type H+-transporting ATPase subunit b
MLNLLTRFAAEEGAKELEVLPDPDELLWGSLFFLVLLIVLIKFVFPKVNEGLAKRTAKIQGQMDAAEAVRREADGVLEEYRRQLADARTEASRIIEEGKRTAEALKADITARAEAEAREIVARAQADVAGERDRAIASLQRSVGDLSLTLAGRVIGAELANPEAQRALVDRAIAELSGGNGRN